MKLLLSITITIKDFFPKNKSIQYENFICLFSLNNFTAKINLSKLNNYNFIKHKVETSNSNIAYNLHMFDSIKNSLIGIYQLNINFDKIKNLNVNDTLTQEETAKIIIDPKTKRKIFDKITNIGDIFLILSTEIKILDKKLYTTGNKQIPNLKKVINNENKENFSDFNLSPRTYKKKPILKSMKNDRAQLINIDNFNCYDEISSNMTEGFKDENNSTFCNGNIIKKHKSLNTAKMTMQINNKYNEFYNTKNQSFNNSCIEIMSPKYSNTHYNFKKDSKIKTNRKKKSTQSKKVTILNLMEEKIIPSLYKKKEENITQFNTTKSKDFKNTSINFRKIQINNNKKNSYSYLNNYKYNLKESKKINSSRKNNMYNESEISQRKSYQYNNKICVIKQSKNLVEQAFSERKCKNKNKLNLMDIGRLNTEMIQNDYKDEKNINNIFLQTETMIKKTSERTKDYRKHMLSDFDLNRFTKEKNNLLKENFQNNYITEKTRGTFSPKISLKIKFPNDSIYSNDKNDKYSNKYKERMRKKILTPKGNTIKKVSFSNEDYLLQENEELKKKCFHLIDFYSLLKNKLKKTCINNFENLKKLKFLKQDFNNLKKYKNRIAQMENSNESKKVINHTHTHFEEENLLNKMLNIKLKENCIYENIFGNYVNENNIENKVKILISQKKEMFLNLIKNVVKYYGNISQIYNNDKDKKSLFKNLLNKYDIKEKIKTDLNYINYINKRNNFDDRIITEVDEDKENEEEDEDNNDIKLTNKTYNNSKEINIQNINNIFNDNNEREDNRINYYENKIQEIEIFSFKNNSHNHIDNIYNENDNSNNKNIEEKYDENLNNLIEKILIEQFPENYKTNIKFIHQDKNKYIFNNKIFYGYIENNDVILKEEINGIIDNNKYTLNEFYQKYCIQDKNEDKYNFIYMKKIRQKYIKIKNNEDESTEKKLKNENSTTIDTEIKLNTSCSKINEIID